MDQIRLLIVEDQVIVRKGIQLLLSTEPAIQFIGEAVTGPEAVSLAQILQPDVILMGLMLLEGDSLSSIEAIKRQVPAAKIIVLTNCEDENRIIKAVQIGVDGYLLKDADRETLLQAIEAAYHGGMPLHPRIARFLVRDLINGGERRQPVILTEREKEILQLIARGLSNKAVARTLNLSEGTVKLHVSNVLAKLHVSTRTEAALLAVQHGLISSNRS